MSPFPEFEKYDGLGLAALVRAGEVTPGELVEEAISRIEAHNPALNAVVYKMYDQARAAARAELPAGPFRGVPFLLKDILATYAGVPTSNGTRLLRELPMPHDSEVVRRFRRAGLVAVGKTNVPEFGLTPYTESEALGIARNPWDLGRTPGGSSGGSAAAVAAGIVPIAHGSDGGGSIRIPASCCGLFGLKPTRGRVPVGPDRSEVWHGLVAELGVTRSVRDSAALLDAIAGAEVGAPYAAPSQARPFLEEVTAEPGSLRIAYTAEPFMGQSVHEDCRRGLEATVNLLQQLGHRVTEAGPKIDGQSLSVAFITVLGGELRADLEWLAQVVGRPLVVGDFEVGTYALGMVGKALTATDYARAVREMHGAARTLGAFFEQYDLLLTPTLASPPLPIGALRPRIRDLRVLRAAGRLDAAWVLRAFGAIKRFAAEAFGFTPYTAPFNMSGQPAMSVPLYWNAEGLPVGMHFAARFGDEATLFRLAGQLERAQPWFDRVPHASRAQAGETNQAAADGSLQADLAHSKD